MQVRMGYVTYPLLIILGALLFLGYRGLISARTPAFQAHPSNTQFTPPSQAKTGILSQTSGDVLHLVRESDDFQEATPGGVIRQGESVATQIGSATITVGNTDVMTLAPASEITLVQSREDSFLVLLKSGSVTFTSLAAPLSVRARHALISVHGKADISIRNTTLEIESREGYAEIGWVDEQNETHVTTVRSGDAAEIPLP